MPSQYIPWATAGNALAYGWGSLTFVRTGLLRKLQLENVAGVRKYGYDFCMSDKDIQEHESQFPAISGQAFAHARDLVLASGQSVLQTEDRFIFQVFPDGHKKVVKPIEPPIYLEPGSLFTIR